MTESTGGFLRKVIEVTLSSGVTVFVQPLSPFTQRQIAAQAQQAFPLPEPKDYERPVPPEIATIPGQMIDGRENPDWQRIAKEQSDRQDEFATEMALQMTVTLDDADGTIKAAALPYLERLQTAGIIETVDEYTLLRHYVIQNGMDIALLTRAAGGGLPLREEEIRDGMRIFRLHLQRHGLAPSSAGAAAPDLSETLEPERVVAGG